MKLFACVCAVICSAMTIITCSLISASPDAIRGDDKSISLVSDKKNVSYSLLIDELQFHENKDIKIHLIPVSTSQVARIEAIYSEDLDEYGFVAKITDTAIMLSMEAEAPHPIKTFNVVIYAPVNHIEANGSGYRLLVDNPISENFSMYLIGDVQTSVSLGNVNQFLLASAGSSLVDITGTSKLTNIAISGSSSVLAEYLVCDYAKVHISGTGTTKVSINDELHAILKGSSLLEYLGNPIVYRDAIDSTSSILQVSEIVSSALN